MVSLPIVLLIFITSNYPQEKLNEGLLNTPTPQPEKGFVENGKSPLVPPGHVNDLTTIDFKFPDDHSRREVAADKKIIREKVVPNKKDEKDKIPVPLYSLVKNDCGEGYALDENGVCQKTITFRSGKKFDSDKRKKRHLNYNYETQRKEKVIENAAKKDFQKTSIPCSKIYPGMVPDGYGGCKKSIKTLDQPFGKSLPP